MSTDYIEYTYTTYQQPPFTGDVTLLREVVPDVLITKLREMAVIANEKTQFFWCNFIPEKYGMCFLLRTVPTEGEPDTCFGFCDADSEQWRIISIRIWRVTIEKTQGLQWFSYARGVTYGGDPYEGNYPNDVEHAFGYGYDTETTELVPSRRKILFGFHQDIGTPPKPLFILPPKSIFLEGMHEDIYGRTGVIPLYDDTLGAQQVSWDYKEIEKAAETGN